MPTRKLQPETSRKETAAKNPAARKPCSQEAGHEEEGPGSKPAAKKAGSPEAYCEEEGPARKPAAKKPAARSHAKKKAPARKPAAKKPAAKKKALARSSREEGACQKATPSAAFMKPVTPAPSSPLSSAGAKAADSVTSAIWGYIKKNGLQTPNKRMINADARLRPIFGGRPSVNMFEMTKLVSNHLR
jgi:chromatin remodeling complex protein RSC6